MFVKPTTFPTSYKTRDGLTAVLLVEHDTTYFGYLYADGILPVRWDCDGHRLQNDGWTYPHSNHDLDRRLTVLEALTGTKRELADLIVANTQTKKIAGIRMLRQAFGWGLIEAKEAHENAYA